MGFSPLPASSRPRSSGGYVRSDFWFHDGNIVIIAGAAAFRVHRGQLERHSEVFQGLFSLPQPPHQDTIDGCLCVELYDRPSDIFYFLSALYDGLYFKSPQANNFPVIAAVLRLSTKYMVESLRERCMLRLDMDWPSTICGWDHREQDATDENGRYMPRESCPHPILVVELALDMGIPSILPAAFYDLSRYGPSRIFGGTTSPQLAFDTITRQGEQIEPSSIKPVVLSRDLLRRTLLGREAAQRFIASFITTELCGRQPSKDCAHRYDQQQPSRPCHESFYFIMLNILRSIGGIACGRDADPLYTLLQAGDMLSRTDFSDGQRQCGLRLCDPCKLDFATSTTKAREEVWGLLPVWFGLVDNKPGSPA